MVKLDILTIDRLVVKGLHMGSRLRSIHPVSNLSCQPHEPVGIHDRSVFDVSGSNGVWRFRTDGCPERRVKSNNTLSI